VRPANVVILGAGIAGTNACQVAVGVGAHVSILDVDPGKLRYVHDILGSHVTTVMSNRANIEEEVLAADLVIGTVLIPAPRRRSSCPAPPRSMRPGSAFVDVSIDQGSRRRGCRRTAIHLRRGRRRALLVTNMPSVPNATHALTNTTLSYALALADQGFTAAVAADFPPPRRQRRGRLDLASACKLRSIRAGRRGLESQRRLPRRGGGPQSASRRRVTSWLHRAVSSPARTHVPPARTKPGRFHRLSDNDCCCSAYSACQTAPPSDIRTSSTAKSTWAGRFAASSVPMRSSKMRTSPRRTASAFKSFPTPAASLAVGARTSP
jgi:hypothetical protein